MWGRWGGTAVPHGILICRAAGPPRVLSQQELMPFPGPPCPLSWSQVPSETGQPGSKPGPGVRGLGAPLPRRGLSLRAAHAGVPPAQSLPGLPWQTLGFSGSPPHPTVQPGCLVSYIHPDFSEASGGCLQLLLQALPFIYAVNNNSSSYSHELASWSTCCSGLYFHSSAPPPQPPLGYCHGQHCLRTGKQSPREARWLVQDLKGEWRSGLDPSQPDP